MATTTSSSSRSKRSSNKPVTTSKGRPNRASVSTAKVTQGGSRSSGTSNGSIKITNAGQRTSTGSARVTGGSRAALPPGKPRPTRPAIGNVSGPASKPRPTGTNANIRPGAAARQAAPSIPKPAARAAAAPAARATGRGALRSAGRLLGPALEVGSAALEYGERRGAGQGQAQAATSSVASGLGGAGGWMAGAKAGAALGLPLGPKGAAVGGIIGGLLGGGVGSSVAGGLSDGAFGLANGPGRNDPRRNTPGGRSNPGRSSGKPATDGRYIPGSQQVAIKPAPAKPTAAPRAAAAPRATTRASAPAAPQRAAVEQRLDQYLPPQTVSRGSLRYTLPEAPASDAGMKNQDKNFKGSYGNTDDLKRMRAASLSRQQGRSNLTSEDLKVKPAAPNATVMYSEDGRQYAGPGYSGTDGAVSKPTPAKAEAPKTSPQYGGNDEPGRLGQSEGGYAGKPQAKETPKPRNRNRLRATGRNERLEENLRRALMAR